MNGAELRVDYALLTDLHLRVDLSYVNGTRTSDDRPLERIPPLNGTFGLTYTLAPLDLHVTGRFATEQTRLGEFEEQTDGYVAYDVGAHLDFSQWGLQNTLVLSVENLFDTAYREHLSRIKQVMPEPGRNVKALYKLNF